MELKTVEQLANLAMKVGSMGAAKWRRTILFFIALVVAAAILTGKLSIELDVNNVNSNNHAAQHSQQLSQNGS